MKLFIFIVAMLAIIESEGKANNQIMQMKCINNNCYYEEIKLF